MYLVSFLDKASIFALWKPAVWLSRYLSVPRKSELEKATVLLEEWLRIENKLYFRKKNEKNYVFKQCRKDALGYQDLFLKMTAVGLY